MENKNFIVTTDKNTKDKLLTLGFQLINETDNNWTFLNCKSKSQLLFSSIDDKKIVYTNMMCV